MDLLSTHVHVWMYMVDVKRRQQLKANRNSTVPYVPVGTDLSVLQYRYVDGCVFRQGRRGRNSY